MGKMKEQLIDNEVDSDFEPLWEEMASSEIDFKD